MTVREVSFMIRLSTEEHEQLRARAVEEHLSMAQVIRAALRAYLKN